MSVNLIDTGVSHMDGVNEREKPSVKQALIASYNTVLAPRVKALCMDTNTNPRKDTFTESNDLKSKCRSRNNIGFSSWINQFTILLQRSLKERKHESFNTLRVFQVLTASLLAGLMWWRSDSREVQDRLGLFFFISIFWGVLPSFNAVFAFPQERAIFMKERSSGMYTLSSYFMARIIGDLPMELILPTAFLTVTYWMTGMKPDFGAFLLTLLVILGYVLVSQGLGLALGAIIMDAKQASTIVTVTMLAFVITGGYYVHKMPSCLGWMKYISTTFYCYKLLIHVQYGEGGGISYLLGCPDRGDSSTGHGHGNSMQNASCKFVEEDIRGQISPTICVGIMFIMFVGYRLLAYLALRRLKV